MSVPVSIPSPRRSVENEGPGAGAPANSLALLLHARTCLCEAEMASKPADRYLAAHVAALRAATAIVVARAWQRRNARPASVWRMLREVAPELGEWATLFETRSHRRAVAEAGFPGLTFREADDMLRRSGEFVDIVDRSLPRVA